MPGGVNSPVRAFKNVGTDPIFFKSAKGPILTDEDDNNYIDFIGSWGPMILGHSNPIIVEAVKKQLELGTSYGAPTGIENELAELIKIQVPSMQKLRMVNSGTEATMSCIRLARGYSGKNKIIKFTGCYHGHVDSLLVKAGSGVSTFGLPDSPGVPDELAKLTYSCPYNDVDSVTKVVNEIGDDLAAIIVEPIAGNMGFVPGQSHFLKALRDLCDQTDSVLIFDEVMSGFRVALGGAQEIYNIKPDLTALGKVIGGGLPVGAFGGKESIMNQLAPIGPVYQAGTLSGNPLAMSAGIALMTALIDMKPFQSLERSSKHLLSSIKEMCDAKGIPFSHASIGGMFGFFFSEELPNNFDEVVKTNDELFIKFFNTALKNGIYFAPSKYEAGFISTTHNSNILDQTIEKVNLTLKEF
ncbi:MAG: glutamate-1-semialdehyde 2,1-aminomutase [Gammaproteobacteria bacterium]|mgnify:FL=1|jgi:glutamate-1-semialdehyde 2,1-aminomutase|nr:glutamate-1-semialdehyde 2,1-aminomutase [Gammaproteobacteria bacterium]MDO7590014.1 glutamate-1-semialdehyde 2,1-aminomutase [SAR86 cluster bacterium]MDO7676393.1 glutamate-1-semialdehyde 2,1-aminomutase [Gammaproteobacteria bacterium]